jgi:hypothetical protein
VAAIADPSVAGVGFSRLGRCRIEVGVAGSGLGRPEQVGGGGLATGQVAGSASGGSPGSSTGRGTRRETREGYQEWAKWNP